MQYQFLQGYPYYPLNEHEGFKVQSFMVYYYKNNELIHHWDFNTKPPENFPQDWFKQLWEDLNSDSFCLREDQWSSDYFSILNEHILGWTDDRKEGTSYINFTFPIENYSENPAIPEEVKKWIQGKIKKAADKAPGPPDHRN